MKKAVNLDSNKLNHRLGAFMQKILHAVGDKILQILASLLAAAIIACISIMWRLSSTVENHEIRLQSIEAKYVSIDKMKNIELIANQAKDTVIELKHVIEKLGDKIDHISEREADRRK